MKECDKWLKKQPVNIREHMSPNYYTGLEDGWKAAFELIGSWLWLARGHVVDEVKDRIKQELEQ